MKKIVDGVYIEMTDEEIAEFEANRVDPDEEEISGDELKAMLEAIV